MGTIYPTTRLYSSSVRRIPMKIKEAACVDHSEFEKQNQLIYEFPLFLLNGTSEIYLHLLLEIYFEKLNLKENFILKIKNMRESMEREVTKYFIIIRIMCFHFNLQIQEILLLYTRIKDCYLLQEIKGKNGVA